MTADQSISLPAELAAALASAAKWRGLSLDRYAHEVLSTAAKLDAELAADIQQGEDDLVAGRFYTQEQVEAMFDISREQRDAA